MSAVLLAVRIGWIPCVAHYPSNLSNKAKNLSQNNLEDLFTFKELFIYLEDGVRSGGRERESSSIHKLIPQWPEWPELGQIEARRFLWVSHVDTGLQGLGPASTAFPTH